MATNNADMYAHQVTALSLSILRKHAYTRYTDVCVENGDELLSFKTWCIQQSSKAPQFKYWQTVYDMDMLLLRFVRSIRTEDLFLYEKSLDEIADWVFILDHYNYARWLPVHVRDMMNVRLKHPALYRQFADGFFTIAKTQNPFAMIGFDQTHEQQNKELKMHGGTLNLSVSSPSGLWWDRKLPGSSRSLRQASCIRGRMPFSSIMTIVQAFNRGFSHTPRHWS